ncbi:MAG TPA: hypothetical protein P5081_15260 [Phycisphaerae bacterium]|nr:hypothetical protein [Phycisphaerae bacterium]HRW54229.1 hypothetical protein [Phycisphaerae bacterium]
MKRPTHRIGLLMAGVLAAGTAMQGCGTGLTLDSTLADVLNVLTSGDLASAFDAFLEAAGSGRGGLTDDQIASIEELQAQLDAGTLDANSFSEAIGAIVGNRAPGMAFGGFEYGGGPFGMRGPGRLENLLDLTDDQQAQAEEIFTTLHDTIHDLRAQAQEDIRAELTEEQLATLDGLRPGAASDESGARIHGHGPHGGGSFSSSFAELLDLTDDQVAAIDAIREALRADIQAAHETAREAFLAILTDEQLATLDAFEAAHGHDDSADDETDTDDVKA